MSSPASSDSACTCKWAEPKRHSETLVSPGAAEWRKGRAVYLDYIEDDTEFDPACPFHGRTGRMVSRIAVSR